MNPPHGSARRRRLAATTLAAVAILVSLPACDLPLGLGLPATRALQTGAAAGLDSAPSFRLVGSYGQPDSRVTIDLELARPNRMQVSVGGAGPTLGAIVIGSDGYFKGHDFLVSHLGSDPQSSSRIQAAGDAWWKGPAVAAPRLPAFTTGKGLTATFLGSAVKRRIDHVSAEGVPAVELSGPRADVFIAAAPPHQLLEVRMNQGAVIDGIHGADFRYGDYGRDFHITAPAGAIDFANLSTLPPIYTVTAVDTTACGARCTVSATLINVGGRQGARAPSRITFTLMDPGSQTPLGTCSVEVAPDVDLNQTTKVTCFISGVSGDDHNGAVIIAAASNPGRA